MRDMRLLLVLLVSLVIIAAGGVMVPMLLGVLSLPAERIAAPAFGSEAQARRAADAAQGVKAEEVSPAAVADVDRMSEAFRGAARRAGPAVVAIGTSQTVRGSGGSFGGMPDDLLRKFFGIEPGQGPTQKFQRQGLGSGVIVDADGYILTNNHVVEGADEITVHLADDREFKAQVVGADPPTDIAVIKIKTDRLPVAELGDSDKVQVGDWVIAIGAPFGLEKTVTSGIISATGRAGVGITDYESFLQTDAAINPGNSGGPLVNMRGQVIGVNTAIASRSGGYMGVGFAVPIDLAREVMKRIRETGQVIRGWMGVGIQKLTPEMAQSMKLGSDQGVLVSQVFEGGPADKAGIKTGDVIVELGGKPVKSPSELQNTVAWTAPGTKVDVVVIRGGARRSLKVTVEKRASQPEMAAAQPGKEEGRADLKDLGIEVSAVTPEAARVFGYRPGQGVLITGVDSTGLGGMAGLRPGMLILQAGGQKVATVTELREALGKADLAKGVPLLVRQGTSQMFILLKKR
jgi:serine protease Do